MSNVYLILGGNIGEMPKNLANAITNLNNRCGTITVKSSVYETEPWGFFHENKFLNQVVNINTELSPIDLLKEIKSIEETMGRKSRRGSGYDARLIDIDILFYENKIFESEDLIIPHPRICERNFVLEPLSEIAGEYIHPIEKKTIRDLLHECKDNLVVTIL